MDEFDPDSRMLDKEYQALGEATIKKIERLAKKYKRVAFGMTIRLDDTAKWNVWTTHGPVPPKKKCTVSLGMGVQVLPRAK